jgi:hypothetical protein
VGRFLPLIVNLPASGVCRFLPPTIRFSASPLEKTDAQIQLARVGFVLKAPAPSYTMNDGLTLSQHYFSGIGLYSFPVLSIRCAGESK